MTVCQLEEVMALAQKHKLQDVEFLRYKPWGRGKNNYNSMRLTNNQYKKIFPLLRKLSQKYKVTAKVDCSFIPMMCYHQPDKERMEQFAVYGCEAGNVLLGIRSDGTFSGCSFLENNENIFNLPL